MHLDTCMFHHGFGKNDVFLWLHIVVSFILMSFIFVCFCDVSYVNYGHFQFYIALSVYPTQVIFVSLYCHFQFYLCRLCKHVSKYAIDSHIYHTFDFDSYCVPHQRLSILYLKQSSIIKRVCLAKIKLNEFVIMNWDKNKNQMICTIIKTFWII